MMRLFLMTALIVMVSGCATVPVEVQDAYRGEEIMGLAMTCHTPYELEQDCSIWNGATRTIIIDGFDLKIAASERGDVILVMDAHYYRNLLKEFFTLYMVDYYHSIATNESYGAVKKVLRNRGIEIHRVRAVKTAWHIDGYILELRSDGYSILKQYSPSQ